MLPGLKDIDYKILNYLSDKELVDFCRDRNETCRDENFWRLRAMDKFSYVPPDILLKGKGVRKWSEYYINDLIKIKGTLEDLISASKHGRLHRVIISIHNGADKFLETQGVYSINAAISNNHFEVVKYLIERGTNLGNSILAALEQNNLDLVKYLVEHGANIESRSILYAITNNNLPMVKYLVENGADIHAHDPIKYAILKKRPKILEYLLSL